MAERWPQTGLEEHRLQAPLSWVPPPCGHTVSAQALQREAWREEKKDATLMFLTYSTNSMCVCVPRHTQHHRESSSSSLWVWSGENKIFLIPKGAQEHVNLYVCVL